MSLQSHPCAAEAAQYYYKSYVIILFATGNKAGIGLLPEWKALSRKGISYQLITTVVSVVVVA